MNLKGANIVVYDCEIERAIDGKDVTWSTFDKMGFSVGCLYDYQTDDYSVYFRDDLAELAERLNRADLVVAFNQLGFDNNLLTELGFPVGENPQFDMLDESRRSVGWQPGMKLPSGLKLDNHLEGTFGKAFMKTGHGEMAPIWWQEGKVGKVVSYCLADVKRERMLFEHIVYKRWVRTPMHGPRFINIEKVIKALTPNKGEPNEQSI